jgi:hypothetical protein
MASKQAVHQAWGCYSRTSRGVYVIAMARPWRPSMDDVDRVSKGGAAKRRGTGSFHIPHRLNSDERPVYEAAKKKVSAQPAHHDTRPHGGKGRWLFFLRAQVHLQAAIGPLAAVSQGCSTIPSKCSHLSSCWTMCQHTAKWRVLLTCALTKLSAGLPTSTGHRLPQRAQGPSFTQYLPSSEITAAATPVLPAGLLG